MKYKIGELEVEATESLQEEKFLVQSEQSAFVISKDDFNKIATKVKEPKFKVGDKVYYIGIEGSKFDCDSLIVQEVIFEDEWFWYELDSNIYCHACESNLFTLEEAIEKLKEL